MAFQGVPCSMLEMMVALAIRIEEHIMEDRNMGNRVGQWFWSMIVSLGLAATDDTRFSEERAEHESCPGLWIGTTSRMEQVVSLQLLHTSIDMRTIDIWYQLMNWLNENEF